MIIDSFLFGWELDLLEMRLTEMDSFVDKFVLLESEQTFQGGSKILSYQENKERFSAWSDKIIPLIIPNIKVDSPWQREYAAREFLKTTLSKFNKNDIILHGDVDELMSAKLGSKLNYFNIDSNIYVLEQNLYSMAVDWLYPMTWQGTTMARVSSLQNMTILDFRNARLSGKKIRDGWHFTWLGGPEFIERKASSFSHTEDEIQNYIKSMGDRLYIEGYHVRGEKLIPVDIDDSFPEYIRSGKCPIEWFRPKIHDTLQYQQQ